MSESQPRELPSHPESRVCNSQAHGIGRVADLGDLVAWNNLGRNIVFADTSFRALAVYDETAFPAQDEPSQFDLDVHAIVRPAGSDWVLCLNHLGTLRAFRASELRSRPDRRARVVAEMRFVEDAERLASLGDRLFASRSASDPSGGLVISEPIDAERWPTDLPGDGALESWGRVTALAASTRDAWLAVGAGRRVGIAELSAGVLEQPRWEVEIPWQAAWLHWEPPLLWVAGPDPAGPGVGDYDWNELGRGGFAGLRLVDGQPVVQRAFDIDVAWGNGGVALCMARGTLCGLDRRGALHRFDTRDGRSRGRSGPLADRSLGIAHAAAIGPTLLAGFNRAGYRLFSYSP